MRLTDMNAGETALIVDLSQMASVVRTRMIQLGAGEGVSVQFVKALPLGGPCMLETNGQLIGLRRKDAALIGVKRV